MYESKNKQIAFTGYETLSMLSNPVGALCCVTGYGVIVMISDSVGATSLNSCVVAQIIFKINTFKL